MTVYVGTDGADWAYGGEGDDRLNGRGGDDTLLGGNGADTLLGGAGDDRISASDGFGRPDADLIDAGAGDDEISADAGDTVDGGNGVDVVQLNFTTRHSIKADLRVLDSGGTVVFSDGTSLTNVEGGFVDLDAGNDRITLGDLGFRTFGREGDDRLVGGGGGDFLEGDQGADTLLGRDGNDELLGNMGDAGDVLKGGAGDDDLSGDTGDTILGGSGYDTISFSFMSASFDIDFDFRALATGSEAFADGTMIGGVENGFVGLGGGNDRAVAGDGVVTLFGGGGDDQLIGSVGADYLNGDGGYNTLSAGDGDDRLLSWGAGDQLTGGLGSDLFQFWDMSVFGDVHRITDLSADDWIELGFDADINTDGFQTFVFVTQFHGDAGEARITYDKAARQTRLDLDVNGDKHADMTILMDGDHRDFTNFMS